MVSPLIEKRIEQRDLTWLAEAQSQKQQLDAEWLEAKKEHLGPKSPKKRAWKDVTDQKTSCIPILTTLLQAFLTQPCPQGLVRRDPYPLRGICLTRWWRSVQRGLYQMATPLRSEDAKRRKHSKQ